MKVALGHQADFGTAPLPEAAADAVQKERQDFPLVIASMPATERQRTMAVGIVIFLIAAAVLIAAVVVLSVRARAQNVARQPGAVYDFDKKGEKPAPAPEPSFDPPRA